MGNVYQCVTAGTSTSAPTGNGTAINNGGTAYFNFLSTYDYASLADWAAALPTTLTQPVVASLWNNGPITTAAGTPFLTLSGHTTSSSNNITITAANGESFISYLVNNPSAPLAFSSNGVNFVLPSAPGNINYFNIQDANVVFQGLQFQDPYSASNSTILQFSQTAAIAQCIIDGYGQAGGSYIFDMVLSGPSTSAVSFLDCLVIDRASSSSTGITCASNYNTVIANCTFVLLNGAPTQGGIVNKTAATGVTFTVTNTIMMGYNGEYALLTTGGSITETYGLFSASSVTGAGVTGLTGNVYNAVGSSTFVNPTTNFRLIAGSPAINTGTADTADIPSTVDIIGTTRPQGPAWDIGAYEFFIPSAVGTAAGLATVSGRSGVGGSSIGKAAGLASIAGVAYRANVSIGQINGQATVNGSPLSGSAIGKAGGQTSVIGYTATGEITASISINPIGAQTAGQPFPVTGTYTLTPLIEFADDSSTSFSAIPSSGITSIGSTSFTFINPPIPTVGQHSVLVEDLTTGSAAAQSFPVVSNVVTVTTTNTVITTISGGLVEGNSLTALASIIPAYVYQQYADDDNIQAIFAAYNSIAQTYLAWFNALNLPVYTGPLIVGPLLDWVAEGIYGITRPTIALSQSLYVKGDFNTYNFNSIDFNAGLSSSSSTLYTVTDDIFKRILTWTLYKGDGNAFNVFWLKRRVARFLAGVNGTDYFGPTDQVSVTFSGTKNVTITITNGVIQTSAAQIFQAAVLSGVLPLPFQYSFTVLLNIQVVQAPVVPLLSFTTAANSQYAPAWGF